MKIMMKYQVEKQVEQELEIKKAKEKREQENKKVVKDIGVSACFSCFVLPVGAPVNKKVNLWPVELLVPDSSPTLGGIFKIIKGIPLHSLSLSSAHISS